MDRGEIAQRHARAGRGGECDCAYPIDVASDVQRQHQPHRHRALSLPHRGRDAPGKGGFQSALRILHRNAGPSERLPVEAHLQLRRRSVSVEVEIDDARQCLERLLGLFQGSPHSRQIGTENLQHHLAAHAADRFLDVVLHRLREVVTHAGNFGQRVAHFVYQAPFVVTRAPFAHRLQAYEGFAHVDTFVVGAVLGPALLAQGFAYLGEREDPPPHFEKNILPFFQSDARRHLDEQLYVAFIQLWQELGAETRERQHRQRRQDKCRGENLPPALEQP